MPIRVDENVFYSLPEVARLFGCSRRYLQKVRREGRLHASNVGPHVLIAGVDLLRFLAAGANDWLRQRPQERRGRPRKQRFEKLLPEREDDD